MNPRNTSSLFAYHVYHSEIGVISSPQLNAFSFTGAPLCTTSNWLFTNIHHKNLGFTAPARAGSHQVADGAWDRGKNLSIFWQKKNWLVVDLPLLKNMSSSVGMMKFPIYRKIKNVPNHQPAKKILFFPQMGWRKHCFWGATRWTRNWGDDSLFLWSTWVLRWKEQLGSPCVCSLLTFL